MVKVNIKLRAQQLNELLMIKSKRGGAHEKTEKFNRIEAKRQIAKALREGTYKWLSYLYVPFLSAVN